MSAVQNKVDAMVKHLASLSSDRLIISFAPKTLAYSVLKRIGELFPGPSKVTLPICILSDSYHVLSLLSCVPLNPKFYRLERHA